VAHNLVCRSIKLIDAPRTSQARHPQTEEIVRVSTPTWQNGPSAAADQTSLRRANLGLVLRHLRDRGPRSRARLAADLGLNKATVSSLVAELTDRGLVRDGGPARGAVGRPATTVEIDGRRVCGVGAEINVQHVATLALDLHGDVASERRLSLDAAGQPPETVVDHLAALLAATMQDLDERGALPVGLVVGTAGLIDSATGALALAPNLGWRDVPVAAMLRERMGEPAYPIEIDNEANLAAVAEATHGAPHRSDILVIHGEIGVGGGIITDGRQLRGHRGYAGEFGHMTVDAQGRRCGCGRRGCWETVVGLARLLDLAADPDDPVRAPDLSLEARMDEINRRAALGDDRTLAALREIGHGLGIGAAMLANALNPGVIVLSGYFAEVGPWLREVVEAELAAGVLASEAGGTTVALSTLGFTAAVRGGAALAVEHVFDDPTVVARRTSDVGVMS
jgi:predicted NBD/HSP70 family sugar kinase